MENLFSFYFWFNQRPGLLIPFWRQALIGAIVIFLALTIAAAIIKRKRSLYAKLFDRIFNFSLANTLIGAGLFFFNFELIPLLSARFWYILWAAGIIIWLYFIFRYASTLPRKKEEAEKEREFQKYIPK